MNKFWGKILGLVCFLSLFAWTVFADQQPTGDFAATNQSLNFIIKAMEDSGAYAQHIQLHYGTTYHTYESREEVANLADKLAQGMQLDKPVAGADNEFSSITSNEGVLTELRVIAIPGHSINSSWDSYITVRLNADSKDVVSLKKQLKNVYKVLGEFKILPQFNSCIQGIYSGTLKNDVQRMKINQLFTQMGATVVEKVEDSTVKSYSGYTSDLTSFITTNGHKMNVQAAMHVDLQQQVTRLTIGTPIITMEY